MSDAVHIDIPPFLPGQAAGIAPGLLRVCLDTNVIRHFVGNPQGGAGQRLPELRNHRRWARLSLTFTSIVELLAQMRGPAFSDRWSLWVNARDCLREVVDAELPILFGFGDILTMRREASHSEHLSFAAERMRIIWHLFLTAKSADDLGRDVEMPDETGAVVVVASTDELVLRFQQEQRSNIMGSLMRVVVERWPREAPAEYAEWRALPNAERARGLLEILEGLPALANLPADEREALRPHTRLIAAIASEAIAPDVRFDADARENQGNALDVSMLMSLALPRLLILSHDGALRRRLQLAGARGAELNRVLTLDEFLDRAGSPSIAALRGSLAQGSSTGPRR